MSFPRDIGLDLLQRAMTSPNGLKVSTNKPLELRKALRSIVNSLGINPFDNLKMVLAPLDEGTLYLIPEAKFHG